MAESLDRPSAAGHAVERSYGRRRGRPLRAAQQDRLDRLLPRFGLALPERRIDARDLFPPQAGGPVAAVWLEIGFGGGEHLAGQAQAHPTIGMIGCEPYWNGVVAALGHIERGGLTTVRLWPDDARPLIDRLADRTIERVFLLFPDPWPKARHAGRRLGSAAMLTLLARVMARGAELRIATDDQDYFDWMLVETANHPAFRREIGRSPGDALPADWLETRYQAKAARRGVGAKFLRLFRSETA